MARHRLAIIIPTKDRPAEVARILANIAEQGERPCRVIIVDGGVSPAIDGAVARSVFPDLAIERVAVYPPSLTAQRNAGIRAVPADATHVAFFDDDVLLEEGALEAMMRFWGEAADDVGGAGFNLTNEPYRKPTYFEKFFCVNADRPSMILRSGFQSKVSCIRETARVGWLPGCAMVWRRDVFAECMFDERFSGYARYEEVDFSHRVGRKRKLYIVAGARAAHLSRPESAGFSFALGRMETVNRMYFVRKSPELSVTLCAWGLFGMLLNNIVKGVSRLDRRYLERARGNLSGFASLLLNQ